MGLWVALGSRQARRRPRKPGQKRNNRQFFCRLVLTQTHPSESGLLNFHPPPASEPDQAKTGDHGVGGGLRNAAEVDIRVPG